MNIANDNDSDSDSDKDSDDGIVHLRRGGGGPDLDVERLAQAELHVLEDCIHTQHHACFEI